MPETGSIRSPRPLATAGPAAKNHGTSLPREPPISARRSSGQSMPHASAAARIAVAASLDPPPRPAPEGIRFTSSISSPRDSPAAAASARTARTTRFDRSAGTSRRRAAPLSVASLPANRTRSTTGGSPPAPSTPAPSAPSCSASPTATVSCSVVPTMSDSIS